MSDGIRLILLKEHQVCMNDVLWLILSVSVVLRRQHSSS